MSWISEDKKAIYKKVNHIFQMEREFSVQNFKSFWGAYMWLKDISPSRILLFTFTILGGFFGAGDKTQTTWNLDVWWNACST